MHQLPLTTTVCDSFCSPAMLSSASLRAGRSVCVVESRCSVNTGCWIVGLLRSAALSLAPMPGPSSRRFPRTPVSRYRVILLFRSSPCFTENGFLFNDMIAWEAELSARFLNWGDYHSDSFARETDFRIVRRMHEYRKRLLVVFPGDVSPYGSRVLGVLAGSLITGKSRKAVRSLRQIVKKADEGT